MKTLESILIFAQNYSDLNKFAAGKYDHIDFKPPESVAKAAKTGLELRKKNKGKGGLSTQEAGKQGIGSGVARAVSLANRKNISPATARRMKAFFDRHEKSKKIDPGKTHATDKGWIAWCLKGNSMVLLEDGTSMPISEIVDKQLNVKVISYNEKENKFEPKRVTGWSKDISSIEDFFILGKDKTDRRGVSNRTYLAATAEHPFYVNGEWVEAQFMKDKDLSLIDYGLDNVAEQVLFGTMLGDSYLYKSSKNSASLRMTHSIKQESYLNEKIRILSNLNIKSYIGTASSGYGKGKIHKSAYSSTSMYLNSIKNIFYPKGKKEISINILNKIGDIGLAIWIMDDGKLKKSIKNGEEGWVLHTEGFDDVSVNNIIYYLNNKYNLNIKSHYRENTNGQYLYFNKKDTDKMMAILAKYFHPSMRYKLYKKYRNVPYELDNYIPKNKYIIYNQKVFKFGKASKIYKSLSERKPYKWKYRYNLEIEDNHNFIANGILVHNCLWGGDAGRSWANKLCKQMDAADSSKADDVSYSNDVNYNKDSCPECKDPHCCMNFASTHDLSDGDTNEAKCTGYKSSPVGSPRQRAFCKRHCGMKKKLTSKKVADDPESCINKGLRRWKCRCS